MGLALKHQRDINSLDIKELFETVKVNVLFPLELHVKLFGLVWERQVPKEIFPTKLVGHNFQILDEAQVAPFGERAHVVVVASSPKRKEAVIASRSAAASAVAEVLVRSVVFTTTVTSRTYARGGADGGSAGGGGA